MSLSSSLVSQFVKITKDEQEPNKETTVYGTIQKNKEDDTMCVKLDGSEILTPVKSTVVLEEGDRVTVMIKNHTATVTGNLTNPAASEGDTVRVKQLEAEKARIATLETANLTVQDTLNAQQAVINDLDTTYATIKYLDANYLTADDIKTDYLSAEKIDADYAKINDVKATYATISELTAAKGDIRTLNSEIANIDTLIFGSATGDVIQTSFSNAVIAQLGDAQIKSAMIESVSAGKITAGDIITNNVHVKSEDGSLIISDETLKITDDNEVVRVQIGKDASDDYSINIWDQNGNLMFSKGGITDAAIKKAIIRNDMVSDNANIHASKLDVDSLFEEINDSSNTIKSTKVYLDEEKQTLEVAFKSLTTEVTDQGEIISSQGTAISAIQGQISSKVWQQDIDTAKNEMSTQYSTLEQEVDSFQTTVSETYATKISLTDTYNRTIHKSGTVDLTGDEYDEDTYYPVVGEGMPFDGYRHIAVNVQLNSGSKPSWSTHDSGFTCNASVRMKAGGWGTVDANTLGWIDDFTYNFCDKMPVYIQQNRNASKPVLYLRGGGRYFVFTDYDTSWTIYNEDYTQNGITFLTTTNPTNSSNLVNNWNTVSRLSTAESSITQLSNKITANVTETTNLGTRMSTIEQTAESLSVEITNLEIGGRNILRQSGQWTSLPTWWISSGGGISLDTSVKYLGQNTIKTTVGNGIVGNRGGYFEINPNKTYTYSAMIMSDTTLTDNNKTVPLHYHCSVDGSSNAAGVTTIDYDQTLVAGEWKQIYLTFKPNGKYFRPYVYWGTSKSMTFNIAYLKLEEGTKPTAWTPAPEDVESDILEASKTATNYLNFSSSGLVIGDMTASTLGKNVLIDSESVNVRTGNIINAKFGADIIELAKNNESATISMLNDTFKIYYDSDTSEAGLGIYGKTSDGKERLAFQPVNENNNLTIGWGGYDAKANSTNIYGHNMKLLAGNDMLIENDHWQINIDGNLFAKASNSSYLELIGLSSDDNTAIGHGGYTSSLGKTNIYGNKINHIVNTSRGSATYKPYYEAGDSVEIEWYGAGFISSSAKIVYFTIPLAKPIIGGTTPNVSISSHSTDGGLRIRQDGNYVFGSASDTHIAPSSYKAQVSGDGNMVRIEATMSNNTNASNNAPCGVDARIKLTFS